MNEKLDVKLVEAEIKQTCRRKEKIAFRDSAIEKIDRPKITFGTRKEYLIKFDVPKGSSLKVLNFKNLFIICLILLVYLITINYLKIK